MKVKKKQKKKHFKAVIHYVPKVNDIQDFEKGSNQIAVSDVEVSYLFSVPKEDQRDITILVGYDPKKSGRVGSLLLLRYHKLRVRLSHKLNPRGLLQRLTTELRNDGLVRF